ncbi:MAG TPA: tripartite tricarboxylate transporter substrate binding protein [Burkholderiales bacterium]|jgi:tripartite-type tricarboxylate transporter receptor subunit TctC|nr:tripartite tricarboxylate transporter substrate binding protein [Burkholderiales bacterium]
MTKWIAVAGLLAIASPFDACAQTSTYPTKPIRWVVPFAPGGGTDMVARPIAQKLSERLGQPILYDNRGGGGGVIAGEIVARASPDGYTMLVAAVAVMTVNVSLFPKMPFDPVKDFAPITKFAATPNMIATRPGLPVRSVQELVDYGRAHPRKLTCALSGIGSPGHLGIELFSRIANISVVHVTYKGAGPATLALLTGEADLLMANPSVFLPHIKAGRLRAIGVAGPKRISALPDTPTLNESGFPGFESVAWFGLAAPARTPTPIITSLHKEILGVLNQPEILAQFAQDGAYPIGNTPQAFAQEIREEIARWAKVIKDANIKL